MAFSSNVQHIVESEGLLIKARQDVFSSAGVKLKCSSCDNEVFVNLENGSSQCTRCGWVTLPNRSAIQVRKRRISE